MQTPRIVSRIVVPADAEDARNLATGAQALLARDNLLRAEVLDATGRMILHGIHEQHLDAVIAELRTDYGSSCCRVGAPRVLHKEYFTSAADGETKYVRQTGSRGQYGHVHLRVMPCPLFAGYVFENKVVGGEIPGAFIAPIRDAVEEALAHDVLAGHPVDDARIVLHGGSFHDVDSTAEAFRTAATMAFRRAAANASPVVLEPIVGFAVSATLPLEFVPRDLYAPGGSPPPAIVDYRLDASGNALVSISAIAPYSAVLEFAEHVRNVGTLRNYQVAFDGYRQVRLDADEDRRSHVGSPLRPRSPLRHNAAAAPEPDDTDL